MSFEINWPKWENERVESTRKKLEDNFNAGQLPPQICEHITVSQLSFGTIPPVLRLCEISDVSEDLFQAIFDVSYEGDAFLEIFTKVQANSMNNTIAAKQLRVIAADKGLEIPLSIKICKIRLQGKVFLQANKSSTEKQIKIKDKKKEKEKENNNNNNNNNDDDDNESGEEFDNKGNEVQLTAHFQSDPLQSVDVITSFDDFPSIQKFLKSKIENLLRNFLIEDFPKIIESINKEEQEEEKKSQKEEEEKEKKRKFQQQQEEEKEKELKKKDYFADLEI